MLADWNLTSCWSYVSWLKFEFVFSPFRNMNFNNVKVPKVPGGGAVSALIKVGLIGGLGLYAATNSLYNVEGGHRAIMFNRLVGVKDKVITLLEFLTSFTWNGLFFFSFFIGWVMALYNFFFFLFLLEKLRTPRWIFLCFLPSLLMCFKIFLNWSPSVPSNSNSHFHNLLFKKCLYLQSFYLKMIKPL